jgi:glucose/arabinose dehydrogenase
MKLGYVALMIVVTTIVLSACGGTPNRSSSEAATSLPDGTVIGWEEAYGGLEFEVPVGLRHANDQSGWLYVIEKPGTIMAFDSKLSTPEKTVFLDIRNKVQSQGSEQGLLGLAFHPQYDENGMFYVNYTTETSTVIAEYTAQLEESGAYSAAKQDSERILIEFEQPYGNHNGGELAFGPDGFLYIATGDGGSGGDPHNHGQDKSSWLGKILRVDVDRRDEPKEYGIPRDNPFLSGDVGGLPEVFAYGLRNPWRFSFDQETGQLWAADVGQSETEEINLIAKGNNYGWNVMEGSECYASSQACDKEGLTLPVWEYHPEQGGASVTGGYVYRGRDIPELAGRYIFADFIDGRLWSLELTDSDKADAQQLPLERKPGITSFGQDQDGELYACLYDGSILKLVRRDDN